MIRVTAVQPDSIAAELGLREGSELLSINGKPLDDFLDWEFLTADEEFLLHVRQPDGEEIEFDIERPLGEPLGVSLEPARIRRCANRCDFCFVEGNPDGLRPVLYIRDDDYRLSFRYGNFATLTNLKARDVERIKEYRLSPLYVSVHATDPVMRRRLLRNPDAPAILEQMAEFREAGIQFHTQMVIQPGVNDGAILDKSLRDLWEFGPTVLDVSVVPVGLTEFSGHHKVREPTREECIGMARIVDAWGARGRAERGETWCFGADELYLKAAIDGFAAIAFAASFGWGVAASALTVLVVQGTFTLVGLGLGDALPDAHLAALEATGGLLLVGIALRLLRIREIPVADLLPALVVAPVLVELVAGVR